jgi:7-cyano-7-deazaguanine reductase|tara:strand:- start:11 stop:367 length:357 start_codon:yes stop_codon:yes gene_type:complete
MSKTYKPTYKDLEVVDNLYPDKEYTISVSIPEFNCVCPRTSLPDFGCIYIDYVPNKHIVELKSLKLYIVKYRNVGIFHEEVTNKILEDFKRACKPKSISIRGDFSPRGGIKTEVRRSE